MKTQTSDGASYSGKWGTMVTIGLGILMGTLDMSIVNISLPTLVEQLHTDFVTIQWVILGYVLVITSTMLGAARLGDMYEKKKLYLLGLLGFTIGSLLCGLSPNVGWLIAFRILQGFGAVITQALGTAIIVEAFPPYERGRAMGIIGSVVSIGISLGPPLGGLIIAWIGWRWIFLVNVPIGIFTFWTGLRFLAARSPERTNQSFDPAGALILLITLCSFALAMTFGQDRSFKEGLVLALFICSFIGIILFLAIEQKAGDPMVDLSLFKNVPFSLNLMTGFLSFIALSGFFLMPFFLQLVKHYPPQQVGLIMMVTPAAVGLVSPLSGILSDRYGTRGISMIGLLTIAGGCLTTSTLNSNVGVLGYLLRVIPVGIGIGLFQSPNNSAIMGAAPPERLGVASGLLSLTRNLGQTAGIPIMGTLFTSAVLAAAKIERLTDITAVPTHALVNGVASAYRVGAIVIFASALFTTIALWVGRKRNANQTRKP